MKNASKIYFRVLTIAGSDSGGGAGIQADLKTFSALGCFGMSAVTALTAQNTRSVSSVLEVSASFVLDQIESVLSDIGTDAVKIGMLNTAEIVTSVADRLRKSKNLPIVLDPVMVSKSGDRLLQKDAARATIEKLLPVTTVLTPNLPEASILLERNIENPAEMEKAAKDLLDMGPEIVVIKGGHCEGIESNDYYCSHNESFWLSSPRVTTPNTHGTGCTFSSAIAAFLARGLSTSEAVREAKIYLCGAIQAGAEYQLGQGHGPVHHFYQIWKDRL